MADRTFRAARRIEGIVSKFNPRGPIRRAKSLEFPNKFGIMLSFYWSDGGSTTCRAEAVTTTLGLSLAFDPFDRERSKHVSIMLDIKTIDIEKKLESIYNNVRKCCAAASPAAGAAMGKNLKGDLQYSFDLNADRAVRNSLAREFQSGIVLSEESGPWRFGTGSPEYRFVVDPVDGSDNHKRGLPLSAFSLAVLPATARVCCDQVLWGIVGFLEEDAPLIAGRGRGAFRGRESLRVSSARAVSDAFISCELNHHVPSARLGMLLGRARAVRS